MNNHCMFVYRSVQYYPRSHFDMLKFVEIRYLSVILLSWSKSNPVFFKSNTKYIEEIEYD